MPTFQFEAMDPQGQQIRDVIEAPTQDEAQATIRSMGYFVTKIQPQKSDKAGAASASSKKRKTFAFGGAGGKKMVTFTRQLSILQDAGLPILRSLRVLENQSRPGALKNALIDVCDEIEGGSTLSEALAKSPKVFDRLYVNMVKAGEAGGALEVILRRLAEFKERAQSLKNKVIGALIYPVLVLCAVIGVLAFIMMVIIPEFKKIFDEFELDLPWMTELLVQTSTRISKLWFLFPLIPVTIILFISLICKFKAGRMGWHLFLLKIPIFGKLMQKANMARTSRTLGTLVASGVPIIEGLTITRETSGNAMYEKMYARVTDSIREGETIAKPMKKFAIPSFHPVTLFFFSMSISLVPLAVLFVKPDFFFYVIYAAGMLSVLTGMYYFLIHKQPVVEDLVVNMVDVGEETGELDEMLYKVADYYDEEVSTITEGIMKMIEPLMIIFLGVTVGFIVVSLYMPLIQLISGLSGGS